MLKLFQVLLFSFYLSACSDTPYTLTPLKHDAVILAFGDSLTYGSGANSETQSYPAIIAQHSERRVVNAGIPGEVSKAGLIRLPKLLETINPDLVILCHGGNDILQRLDKTQLKANLNDMIKLIKASGAEVILVAVPMFGFGLSVPDLYPELAQQYAVPIEASVLAEVVSDPTLKSDHVHPNAKGYQLFGQRIFTLMQQSGAV